MKRIYTVILLLLQGVLIAQGDQIRLADKSTMEKLLQAIHALNVQEVTGVLNTLDALDLIQHADCTRILVHTFEAKINCSTIEPYKQIAQLLHAKRQTPYRNPLLCTT